MHIMSPENCYIVHISINPDITVTPRVHIQVLKQWGKSHRMVLLAEGYPVLVLQAIDCCTLSNTSQRMRLMILEKKENTSQDLYHIRAGHPAHLTPHRVPFTTTRRTEQGGAGKAHIMSFVGVSQHHIPVWNILNDVTKEIALVSLP